MTTKPEEIARVFKVGDRVRVARWATSMLHLNSEHTVLWVYPDGNIDVSGTGRSWPYSAGRFDLLPADPAREEQPCAACGEKVHDHDYLFAVDWDQTDRVALCESCWSYSRDGEMSERIRAHRDNKTSTMQPEPAAKAPDPYEQHRNELVDRLRQQNRWQPSTPLDVLTAASMIIEDAAPHLWAKVAGKDGRSNRDRLVAGLKAEQAWRERPDMLATFPKPGRNPR